MVIGLCGKYCAGKNEAAAVFAENGFRIVDVDRLGHEALETAREEIAARFGPGVVVPGGGVDRKKLGAAVFADRRKLAELESIVHPLMVERVKNIVSERGPRFVVNAALLFPMGLDALCDRIVIVRAPLLERINRALTRDSLGIPAVLRRIWSQRKLIPQSSFLPADTIIVENSGTRGSLREKVSSVISRLTG
jgi:dephospho-CoA kinase